MKKPFRNLDSLLEVAYFDDGNFSLLLINFFSI